MKAKAYSGRNHFAKCIRCNLRLRCFCAPGESLASKSCPSCGIHTLRVDHFNAVDFFKKHKPNSGGLPAGDKEP